MIFVLIFLTAAVSSWANVPPAPPAGVELEFALVGNLDAQWGAKHEAAARELLEEVRAVVGAGGPVKRRLWAKQPDRRLHELFFRDSRGRDWVIEPESVNTTGLDGLEFVTPPLADERDLSALESVLQRFKSKKKLMKGIRSSLHVTVDVSHLIQGQNYDAIVERILFIENQWDRIYGEVRPNRYGSLVNRFAVPLAADQQDLLEDLANLPREKRTYEGIRRIFLKYDAREDHLRNPDGKRIERKWKYRAANYGKLFGLTTAKPIPVVEFRISDLEYNSKVLDRIRFFRNLVTESIPRQSFEAVFGRSKLAPPEANLRLKAMLGMDDPEIHPVPLVDPEESMEIAGKKITFGWEAEYASGPLGPLFKNGKVDHQRFPFIDSNHSVESATDYREVRSWGGEWRLAEVVDQMHAVQTELGTSLHGFHLHMRIPREGFTPQKDELFKAWLAYLGDATVAWRVQYRRHYYALKAGTTGRVDPGELSHRAAIRLLEEGSYYDVELRGFMGEISLIEEFARTLMTGLKSPETIPPAVLSYGRHFDAFSTELETRMLAELDQFSRTFHGRPISAEEREAFEALSRANDGAGGEERLRRAQMMENLLPFYRLHTADVFDAGQRQALRDAHQNFLKETISVLRNQARGKYETHEEFEKQFRFRVKRWAQGVDLYSFYAKNRLMDPTAEVGRLRSAPLDFARRTLQKFAAGEVTLDQVMRRLGPEHHGEVLEISRRMDELDAFLARFEADGRAPGEELGRQLRKALPEVTAKDGVRIIHLLSRAPSETHREFLKSVLKSDLDETVLNRAVEALGDYTDPETIEFFRRWIINPLRAPLLPGWSRGIRNWDDAVLLPLLSQGWKTGKKASRAAVLRVLAERPHPEGMKYIDEGLKIDGLKLEAIRALGGQIAPESLAQIRLFLYGSSDEVQAARKALMESRAPGAGNLALELFGRGIGNAAHAQVLVEQRSHEMASVLADAILNPSPEKNFDRHGMIAILSQRSDAESRKAMFRILRTGDDPIAQDAILWLANRGNEEVRADLRSILRESEYARYHSRIKEALEIRPMPRGRIPVRDHLREHGTFRGVDCQKLLFKDLERQ